ncbi:MAG TPA: rRNA maturation RNase YbeY [Stellaceae bacterium]
MSEAQAEDCDIEVTVPAAAWLGICADAEAIASTAGRLALAAAIAGREPPAHSRLVIGIRLTDDAEQRRLNHAYRGKDAATNVLSFALCALDDPMPPGSPVLLGDVVLAYETVRREAEEQGKPVADHLSHLVVHGVLHLLGFDHGSDTEAVAMEAREVEILARMGVPDPYRDTM